VNIRELKTRMSTIKTIHTMTHAMKSIAAAKMHHCNTQFENYKAILIKASSFAKDIASDFGYTIGSNENFLSFLKNAMMLEENNTGYDQNKWTNLFIKSKKRKLILSIAPHKGLCGSFFSNNFLFLINCLTNQNDAEMNKSVVKYSENDGTFVLCNSEKLYKKLANADCCITENQCEYLEATDDYSNLAMDILTLIAHGHVSSVEIVYSRFVSTSDCRIEKIRLGQFADFIEDIVSDEHCDVVIKDDSSQVGNSVISDDFFCEYIKLLFSYTLSFANESTNLCENAIRLITMDSAASNASDLHRDMAKKCNQMRQTNVTRELIEIISAAESFKSN
jgi:ATP synthase F1 gamma subunit